MERLAPTSLAQEWDNVGLLAGDRDAPLRRCLLTIDLTAAVLDEALNDRVDLILAYHPPIFKPIGRLCAPGTGMDALVFLCIRAGIAVYSPHTALDAAEGGTNDVLAELCGLAATEPLEYVDQPGVAECKLVTFVPPDKVERVADAMFAAGAGRIGEYDCCSFRSAGQGTFFGGESTNPAVGRRGRMEHVDETRLECILPTHTLPGVVAAMRGAHPYEEPAFDVYALKSRPVRGMGRVGTLRQPSSLAALARRLRRVTRANSVQLVGSPAQPVERVITWAGAASGLPFKIPLTPCDVIVTGEMRHREALHIRRTGCAAIALGHWASERPVLAPLAARLSALLPGVVAIISQADSEPGSPI